MNFNEKIMILTKVKFLRNENEVKLFDNVIDEIADEVYGGKNVSIYPELLKTFDDRTEHYEVMCRLVHLIENFSHKDLVEKFFQFVDLMLPQARYWAKTLLNRMMNEKECNHLICQLIIKSMYKNYKLVFDLLLEINEETDKWFQRDIEKIMLKKGII